MEKYYLDTPEYTIEVWDINGVFVMDISDIVSTSLRIRREINVVDDIAFAIDLVQFEKRCAAINANPQSILEPYRTDIKIRRNNEYFVGGQVVQANINFNASENNKIEIKCTGYLNYFKDRYISDIYRDKTYAQMARQLITDAQSVPNLVVNSHFYEDVSSWVVIEAGYIAWEETIGHDYPGSLYVSISTGAYTYGGARYFTAIHSGVTYTLTFWAKMVTSGGQIYINSGGVDFGHATVSDTNWHQYTYTYTPGSDGNWFDIKTNGSMNFYIDDVRFTSSLDDPSYFDFGVTLGVDEASAFQQDDRIRSYDLQETKDGIVNLTSLENDNFDFEFDANKVFNIYQRLGSDKPQYELVYPQNITSINVRRDASTLANRIIGIGSGIGSERLQTVATSYDSAAAYRVRERPETFNSVQEQATLEANTFGKLNIYQSVYEVPELSVEANHLDLDEVKLGDAINIRIDGSSFVTTINGMYRIMAMDINVNINMEEQVNLDLQRW